jgi:hypothetical protein
MRRCLNPFKNENIWAGRLPTVLHNTPETVAIVIGYFESCLPNAAKSHAALPNFLIIGQRKISCSLIT